MNQSMSESANTSRWKTAYQENANRLIGADIAWLNQSREAALNRFIATGFPTRRDEEWKYTAVAPIEKEISGLSLSGTALERDAIARHLLQGVPTHLLVFVDGHFSPTLSQLGSLPAGVVLDSVSNLLKTDADRLQPYLQSEAEERWFSALNRALMTDGAYLELNENTVLESPVHLLFVASPASDRSALQPRNVVVANGGSRATIIEHYVGLSEQSYLTNTVTEIVAGSGADITHYKVQQEGQNGYHVGALLTRQTGESRLNSHSISLGGRIVRNDIYSRLEAEKTFCTLNGLFLGSNRQHIDNYTWVDHLVPNGTSSEYYKGILDQRARGVFNGRVRVQPDAQQTEAMQSNKNLLLSRDAEIDTKPQLEIYADDVKCSHGATVGELDPKSVFYLRSRGIDEAAARSLLTFAFAGDLLRHIDLLPLRTRLEEIVIARLPQGDSVRDLI